jgi:hypothetical protein
MYKRITIAFQIVVAMSCIQVLHAREKSVNGSASFGNASVCCSQLYDDIGVKVNYLQLASSVADYKYSVFLYGNNIGNMSTGSSHCGR